MHTQLSPLDPLPCVLSPSSCAPAQARAPSLAPPNPADGLRSGALAALCLPGLQAKLDATHALWARSQAAERGGPAALAQALQAQEALSSPLHGLPGRPERPGLIEPALVPQRSPFSPGGLAALVHAIAHIEFNAINLALDAVWRFGGMPSAYYTDWLRVADEEATHFGLLQDHLRRLGHRYGDFDAHDGLWSMCRKTQHDLTARMALVPRTLEARGLDATPLIQAKLRKVATPDALHAVAILDRILADEIGHVAVGNRWYGWLCQRHGLEPLAHYRQLAREHQAPKLRPPFNTEARQQAGFSGAEMADLLGT